MDTINYGPDELKGRELKGEGYTWIYVSVAGKPMYCKVADGALDDVHTGKPFIAYNPWVRGMDGNFIYLPVIAMSVDPMFVSKAEMFMLVHYKVAESLDKMSREAFSGIIVAKEKDVPKAPLKLIRE